VTAAVACVAPPDGFNAPALATAPDATTATTEIPKSAFVSFINLTNSSLTKDRGYFRKDGSCQTPETP